MQPLIINTVCCIYNLCCNHHYCKSQAVVRLLVSGSIIILDHYCICTQLISDCFMGKSVYIALSMCLTYNMLTSTCKIQFQ